MGERIGGIDAGLLPGHIDFFGKSERLPQIGGFAGRLEQFCGAPLHVVVAGLFRIERMRLRREGVGMLPAELVDGLRGGKAAGGKSRVGAPIEPRGHREGGGGAAGKVRADAIERQAADATT